MKLLDEIPVSPHAWYILDRGYLDFVRLGRFHRAQAWFVVRSKHHVSYNVVASYLTSRPTKQIQVLADQTILLKTSWSKKSYPDPLRKVTIFIPPEQRTLSLLTNNFSVESLDIAKFYKSRWQVELFFKWIKQHLRLRDFYGRTPNAVRCQIWSAICAYLMVAIAKKTLNIEKSLYEVLQIISVNPFENQGLYELSVGLSSDGSMADSQKCFSFNDN